MQGFRSPALRPGCAVLQRSRPSRAPRKACTVRSAAVEAGTEVKTPLSASASDVTVAYRTGWTEGKLHGSVRGAKWTDFPLTQVGPVKRRWLFATVPAAEKNEKEDVLLEFVVTNGNGDWDKPVAGGNYQAPAPGHYVLRKGALHKATAPPVMVVSDLDGTMVGDDTATAAFKAFWEEEGCPNGGLLVYNTGRALDSFVALQQEKAHCLAPPDVLISAVGTKIYNFTGKRWEEDSGWRELLDHDWNVHEVIAAASHMLTTVGSEKMHFRPKDEQNAHKVTCGVHIEVVDEVLAGMQQALDDEGLKANLITSGTKDWRFLDVVSVRAGKLEALEYVRKMHGFPLEQTVACGDSGNDILMLSGANLALVVGNAQEDLKRWVEKQQQPSYGGSPPSVPDQGLHRLYVSSKHEAYGILEGLEYWGLKGK